MVWVRAPVLVEPAVLLAPLQPPEAVQDVALVVDQLSVLAWPAATVAGLALNESVGAGAALTVTVALLAVLPPAPLQVRV